MNCEHVYMTEEELKKGGTPTLEKPCVKCGHIPYTMTITYPHIPSLLSEKQL